MAKYKNVQGYTVLEAMEAIKQIDKINISEDPDFRQTQYLFSWPFGLMNVGKIPGTPREYEALRICHGDNNDVKDEFYVFLDGNISSHDLKEQLEDKLGKADVTHNNGVIRNVKNSEIIVLHYEADVDVKDALAEANVVSKDIKDLLSPDIYHGQFSYRPAFSHDTHIITPKMTKYISKHPGITFHQG